MQQLLNRACRLAQRCETTRPMDAEQLDAILLRIAQTNNPNALQQQLATLQQQMNTMAQRLQKLEDGQQQPQAPSSNMDSTQPVAPSMESMDAQPAQNSSVTL